MGKRSSPITREQVASALADAEEKALDRRAQDAAYRQTRGHYPRVDPRVMHEIVAILRVKPESHRGAQCHVRGCERLTKGRALCTKHYNTALRYGLIGTRQCSVKDCQGAHYGRGLCAMHYERWKASVGDPNSKRCKTKGCELPSRRNGLCHKCSQIARRIEERRLVALGRKAEAEEKR